MYQFEKELKEMSVLELMQEYSAIQYELAEGWEYECDQLQDCIEQLKAEAMKR